MTLERTESDRKKGSTFGSCNALARLDVPRGLRSILSVMSAYSERQSVSMWSKELKRKVDSYQTLPKVSVEAQGSPSFS